MEKISINLLPLEFTAQDAKRTQFLKVQFIGIIIILAMFFLSSLTVTLRILQSQNISKVSAQTQSLEQRITSYAGKQTQLLLLKSRLQSIGIFLGIPSKQAGLYNLVEKLLPQALTVSSLSVDKTGTVVVVGVISSADSLDELVSSLTEKEKNEDKLAKIEIDTLSRGREGIYRVSIRITPR